MKLLNKFYLERRFAASAVMLLLGIGVAQAQFTGIGTTAPAAGLHVALPTGQDTTTFNVIEIDMIRRTAQYEAATYNTLLVYNPATGLVRRRDLDELFDQAGEWIENGTSDAIIPRRYQTAMSVNNGLVDIGATATRVGGTFNGIGPADFDNTVNIDNTLNIGIVNAITGTALAADDEILLQRASGSTLVEHVTVADLIEAGSYWDETAGVLTPSNTLINTEVRIADGDVDIVATNIDFTGTTAVTGTLNVSLATELATTLEVTTTTTITDPQGTDLVLIKDLSAADPNQVRSVTIDDLIQDNGEWRFHNAATSGQEDQVVLHRVEGGAPVVIETGSSNFGIGTDNPTQRLQVAGGNILIDNTQAVMFGAATNQILGTGAGMQVTTATYDVNASGAYTMDAATVAITGVGNVDLTAGAASTIDLQAAGGPIATMNVNGLGIGAAAPVGRVLYTATADGVQLNTLTAVTDVDTDISGNTPATDASGAFERVLITDNTGVVRYINAADLVSAASEWVYQDNGTTGTYDAGDLVYLRRNGAVDGGGNDVYATFEGNMVVDATSAYQFGAAARQINATGITADASYTVDINGGSLTFDTDSDQDVAFNENGEPWMYYQANDDYSATNGFGNGGNERGRVGINTNAPEATLHVSGNIVASNITVTSDRRFKKDIKEITGALALVKSLRGVSYDFRANEFPKENFDSENHIGFIAQEIREVLPQTVMERGDGFLTVDYAAVTPVLVEALQELSAQVEALQAENATLRGTSEKSIGAVSTKQLRDLEARLADMDARLQEVAGRK